MVIFMNFTNMFKVLKFNCILTLYFKTDHAVLNKWAVIIDPKDPWKGPTGYVKLDMHVIEEGHQVKVILCLFRYLCIIHKCKSFKKLC